MLNIEIQNELNSLLDGYCKQSIDITETRVLELIDKLIKEASETVDVAYFDTLFALWYRIMDEIPFEYRKNGTAVFQIIHMREPLMIEINQNPWPTVRQGCLIGWKMSDFK